MKRSYVMLCYRNMGIRERRQISYVNSSSRRSSHRNLDGFGNVQTEGRIVNTEDAEKANVISLEEFLEVERHKLGTNLTPVTPESFAKWKKTRLNKKQVEEEAIRKSKEATHAAGKNTGMSGRDLFTFNPEWFNDSDEEEEGGDWDLEKYRRQKEDEDLAVEMQRIRDLELQA